MKDWKLWKIILLCIGTYIGLGLIFTITLFGATGQISEIFGSSSDWPFLWINYTLGHSLLSPGLKILYAADIGVGGDILLMVLILIMLLPGMISSILVGLFAKNSKVAFRVVFLFFITLSAVTIVLYVFDIYLVALDMIFNLVPGFFGLSKAVVILILTMIGVSQSIIHGGIAGQIRNLIKRKQR